jgi:hypothetical protein
MLVVLLTFDWNRAKPWLNARISEMLGHPFAINGDLFLTWEKPTVVAKPSGQDEGWRSIIPWPYLVAQDIHIGNPSNMKVLMPAEMASIKLFAFSLNPLVLLEKQIAIPFCILNRPSAGGAIALAALAPAALVQVVIPLINIGPGEDSECNSLLADVRVKPVAPRPGKTYRRKVKRKRK